MISISDFSLLFEKIDSEFTNYFNNSYDFSDLYLKNYSLKYKYWNERTLAAYTHFLLVRFFPVPVYYNANEFTITQTVPVSSGERDSISVNATGTSAYSNYGSLFIPDTFLCTHEKDNCCYYFEYKVDSKFSYVKLAKDFVKFCLYTSLNVTNYYNDVFVYMIFNVDKLKISTVLKSIRTGKIDIALLKPPVTVSDIDSNHNIYIFERSAVKKVDNDEMIISNIEIIEEACKTLANESLYKKLDSVKESNIFYDLKDGLGPNVAYAKIVRKYYKVIDYLFNYFTNKTINPLDNNPFSNKQCASSEDYFTNICKWFNSAVNVEKTERAFETIDTNIVNANKRKSALIIILLYKYIVDNEIDFDWRDTYLSDDFENIDETIDNYITSYQGIYSSELEGLVLGLVYFLHELLNYMYSDIYRGTDSDNLTIIKQRKNIISHLNSINRLINSDNAYVDNIENYIDSTMKSIIKKHIKL